jgi:hypothetical protein
MRAIPSICLLAAVGALSCANVYAQTPPMTPSKPVVVPKKPPLKEKAAGKKEMEAEFGGAALQKEMDRKKRNEAAVSNAMKKTNDTASEVTRNIK